VVSSLQPGGSWLATAPREEWPEDLDADDGADDTVVEEDESPKS
jgi:hypothetical protein